MRKFWMKMRWALLDFWGWYWKNERNEMQEKKSCKKNRRTANTRKMKSCIACGMVPTLLDPYMQYWWDALVILAYTSMTVFFYLRCDECCSRWDGYVIPVTTKVLNIHTKRIYNSTSQQQQTNNYMLPYYLLGECFSNMRLLFFAMDRLARRKKNIWCWTFSPDIIGKISAVHIYLR